MHHDDKLLREFFNDLCRNFSRNYEANWKSVPFGKVGAPALIEMLAVSAGDILSERYYNGKNDKTKLPSREPPFEFAPTFLEFDEIDDDWLIESLPQFFAPEGYYVVPDPALDRAPSHSETAQPTIDITQDKAATGDRFDQLWAVEIKEGVGRHISDLPDAPDLPMSEQLIKMWGLKATRRDDEKREPELRNRSAERDDGFDL